MRVPCRLLAPRGCRQGGRPSETPGCPAQQWARRRRQLRGVGVGVGQGRDGTGSEGVRGPGHGLGQSANKLQLVALPH